MPIPILLVLQTASTDILVTASRAPVAQEEAPASSTVIDERRIDALGAAQAVDLLRIVPGVSVAVSGSRGSQAQVRIRGAEANHSLLFFDGIRFNDPAAANEPRFETLGADGLGRIEVVRGPQSALWGSEAIGGVIALQTPDPLPGLRLSATGEYGSHESLRGAALASFGGSAAGATLTVAHLESDGIDILGGGTGDRDGFRNTTAAVKAQARPASDAEIGIAARYIRAYSEFDGMGPVTFLRADTLDNSKAETGAVRAYALMGTEQTWSVKLDGQYLASSNRNRSDDTPLNRTEGERYRLTGQIERPLALGDTRHRLIAAAEHEGEDFQARDQQYFGATDQDSARARTAFVGEWRADWGPLLATDVAIRHDDFSRFADETTVRASALARLGDGLSLNASYGEGVAQPTFTDLFGFFPGSFVGNPALKPETSKGYEVGLRWRGSRAAVVLAAFDNRLKDEIVPVLDPVTFLSSTANATGTSKWRGLELSAEVRPLESLRISANYTLLDAEDQQVAGDVRLKEVRRPRHSANAALDYDRGPVVVGAALSYVWQRRDTDFDIFQDVTLDDYLLASLRIAWRISDALEAFSRVENAFDADYQDVVGYATPGRTVHAGIRVRLGR